MKLPKVKGYWFAHNHWRWQPCMPDCPRPKKNIKRLVKAVPSLLGVFTVKQ